LSKSLFNFYLDDEQKQKAQEKLNELCGEQAKGQLASFLRVCINKLLHTPNEKVNKDIVDAIKQEYIINTKSNKRSRM
jgi:glutamyl-tRNA reductase